MTERAFERNFPNVFGSSHISLYFLQAFINTVVNFSETLMMSFFVLCTGEVLFAFWTASSIFWPGNTAFLTTSNKSTKKRCVGPIAEAQAAPCSGCSLASFANCSLRSLPPICLNQLSRTCCNCDVVIVLSCFRRIFGCDAIMMWRLLKHT